MDFVLSFPYDDNRKLNGPFYQNRPEADAEAGHDPVDAAIDRDATALNGGAGRDDYHGDDRESRPGGIDLGSFERLPEMYESGPPDYYLPTAVSVNMIPSILIDYPELVSTSEPPVFIGGSIFIFPPIFEK